MSITFSSPAIGTRTVPALVVREPRVLALLMPFVIGSALIADRAQLGISTGGRGALPIVAILAPIVALAAIVQLRQARTIRFLGHPVFLIAVAPYLVLTGILPILGVLLNGYPDRTLLAAAEATSALSFMVLGAAMGAGSASRFGRWLIVGIVIQLLYSLGQAIYLAHGPGWELFAPFHEWDLAGADLKVLVQARSTGLYINPNELGFWAAVVAVMSWTLLSGRARIMAIALSLLTLLLSESRGAGVALVVAACVAVLDAIRRDRGISLATARSSLRLGLAVLVAVGAGLLLAPAGSLTARFQSLLNVSAEGAQADPNLAGRLDYWVEVTLLNGRYPWGTFGSPEVLLGSAIDSSWFRAFAEGSVLYVVTLALLLLAAIFTSRSPYARPLRLVAILVAVAGVTQTPLIYPAGLLFWVLLGAELQWSEATRPAPVAPQLRRPNLVRT